ncbi:hypothetical protein CDD83_4068 [Cordyceps sp. RAO-2017]|nr:hypothetical protein CDD83_4068 [Cordyceps sp. RAO-2017]
MARSRAAAAGGLVGHGGGGCRGEAAVIGEEEDEPSGEDEDQPSGEDEDQSATWRGRGPAIVGENEGQPSLERTGTSHHWKGRGPDIIGEDEDEPLADKVSWVGSSPGGEPRRRWFRGGGWRRGAMRAVAGPSLPALSRKGGSALPRRRRGETGWRSDGRGGQFRHAGVGPGRPLSGHDAPADPGRGPAALMSPRAEPPALLPAIIVGRPRARIGDGVRGWRTRRGGRLREGRRRRVCIEARRMYMRM